MGLKYKDLRCPRCGREEEWVAIWDNEHPNCCGERMDWLPSPVYTACAGGGFYSKALDMEFTSKADMRSYAKAQGLSQAPSADKHHGARNESHLNLGKLYSYRGQKNRSGYSDQYGKD